MWIEGHGSDNLQQLLGVRPMGAARGGPKETPARVSSYPSATHGHTMLAAPWRKVYP